MSDEQSTKPTVILNTNDSDGFLDLSLPFELAEVIKVLNKLNER